MVKKLSLVLSLVLVLGLFAGCAGTTTSTAASTTAVQPTESTAAGTTAEAAKSDYFIGYSTLTTEGDFMSSLATALEERFTAQGAKFEVASCDLNPAKQIEQIENFISLGVDGLLIMAVDPSSLTDVIKKARSQGVKVVAFSQETAEYDMFIGSDEYATGKQEANMAAQWIEKTFPDAAAGSVEVAIFENRDKPTAAERSDGLKEIEKLTDKAKVVQVVGVDTTPKSGQSAAENLLLSYPDVKVILSYNGDTAMGVDAYAMAMNSRIQDKANFATFGIDFNGPAIEAIQKSVNNESIWRGTIMMGKSLDFLYDNITDLTLQTVAGTNSTNQDYAVLYEITPDNLGDVLSGKLE